MFDLGYVFPLLVQGSRYPTLWMCSEFIIKEVYYVFAEEYVNRLDVLLFTSVKLEENNDK